MREGEALLPPADLGDDWYGFGGIGDYAPSHGNTPEVTFRAHSMRDGGFEDSALTAAETGERFDLVIVGGGLAGLGAAHRFVQQRPTGTVLILDNHPVFGGEAKRNEFLVDGHRLVAPQGSNGFSLPEPTGGEFASGDARYFQEFSLPRVYDYPPDPPEAGGLRFANDHYGFLHWLEDDVDVGYYFNQQSHAVDPRWAINPWQNDLAGMPVPEQVRQDLVRWRDWSERPAATGDFATWLDSMSYREFVLQVMGLSPEVADYVDPICASASGGSSDILSAYSGYAIGLPGTATYYDEFALGERHSFPGGNDGFARYFVKAALPKAIEGDSSFEQILDGRIRFDRLDRPESKVRVRLASTAVRVAHDGDPSASGSVTVTYVKDRRLHRVQGSAVVMATGAWVNKYVVTDLPTAYRDAFAAFHHTAFLVANVAVRHWRFLVDLGISGFRWWDDFGFACNLRRPMHVGDYKPVFHPDLPAVLSFYIPFSYPGLNAEEQGIRGRNELLAAPFAHYEERIRRLMTRLFASHGFDDSRDVAGIILNRWGHAYVVPEPGFYFGKEGQPAPRDVVREPHGRIAFAHSELRGNQHWGPAAEEGARAVDQLLERL